MIHTLANIYDKYVTTEVNGKIVKKVAEPYSGRSFRAAWAVLTGKAYAIRWPKDGELEKLLWQKSEERYDKYERDRKAKPDAS